jgi:hypothetical protein
MSFLFHSEVSCMSFLIVRFYRTKNKKGIMIVNRRAAIIVVGVAWRGVQEQVSMRVVINIIARDIGSTTTERAYVTYPLRGKLSIVVTLVVAVLAPGRDEDDDGGGESCKVCGAESDARKLLLLLPVAANSLPPFVRIVDDTLPCCCRCR